MPDAVTALVAPWAKFFSHSKLAATAVTFLHIAPLVVGGGLAIALDRSTLRVSDDPDARVRHLDEMRLAHRSVIVALAIAFVTGGALLAAELDSFLSSAVFWAKMALVAGLLANGVAMNRTENRLRGDPTQGWEQLRLRAVTSLVLWLAVTLMGVALTNVS